MAELFLGAVPDLSKSAAEWHFENLFKGNCCCESGYSQL